MSKAAIAFVELQSRIGGYASVEPPSRDQLTGDAIEFRFEVGADCD